MGPILVLRIVFALMADADVKGSSDVVANPFSLTMVDIRKAYPQVVRKAMENIFRRSGVPERCARVLSLLGGYVKVARAVHVSATSSTLTR